MKTARWRIRDIVGAVLLPAGIILAICPCLFGLDQSLDVSQYVHTSWKIREGFTKGTVSAIAQTADGYLWLGTEFGLLRFDGVKAVPWQAPQGQHLPSERIYNLLAARDGTLWIGTTKGLASWRDGKLTQYPALAGQSIRAQIVEDYEGTVWAGSLAAPPFGKLCAIAKGGVQCYGDEGSLGSGVGGLYQDHNRNLWVGVRNGLWRWKTRRSAVLSAAGAAEWNRGHGRKRRRLALIRSAVGHHAGGGRENRGVCAPRKCSGVYDRADAERSRCGSVDRHFGRGTGSSSSRKDRFLSTGRWPLGRFHYLSLYRSRRKRLGRYRRRSGPFSRGRGRHNFFKPGPFQCQYSFCSGGSGRKRLAGHSPRFEPLDQRTDYGTW